MLKTPLFAIAIVAVSAQARAASYYPLRLDDPRAVYLTRPNFPVRGDGLADDTAAIQQAINKVHETTSQGILFIPEGRYRLTKTIYIWAGIRVIGYGANRPVLLLGPNTPGYQNRDQENLMVFFAGRRPGFGRGGPAAAGSTASPGDGNRRRDPANGQVPDASAGTFYSALSNVDLEIGDGNPGAVGVRAHYAQHCFLAHMDFRIGSGLAGIHEAGNVAEDVHFHGGQYGIWTRTPSPGWQFTVVDGTFEGQRQAAIQERAAGLTLIRPHFKNVPTAIAIDTGFPDDLWVKDARLEDITGPAVVIGLENSARTQINLEGVACQRVPVFAAFAESGRKVAGPSTIYEVKEFAYGLTFARPDRSPGFKETFAATPLDAMPT